MLQFWVYLSRTLMHRIQFALTLPLVKGTPVQRAVVCQFVFSYSTTFCTHKHFNLFFFFLLSESNEDCYHGNRLIKLERFHFIEIAFVLLSKLFWPLLMQYSIEIVFQIFHSSINIDFKRMEGQLELWYQYFYFISKILPYGWHVHLFKIQNWNSVFTYRILSKIKLEAFQ